jgi:hypothetical protein
VGPAANLVEIALDRRKAAHAAAPAPPVLEPGTVSRT